ncbi:hypothetical protein, partial [Paraburkholderia sp. RL17-373-BIF-A]|uniref:hypothetical protein n=1 Tax=Paraburkholderia sp. RL17-373-BIF-A TaxID=3031629 RepID=UPI0038BE13C9
MPFVNRACQPTLSGKPVSLAANLHSPGAKDLLLSLLTFGIYGLLKVANLRKKEEIVKRAMEELGNKLTSQSGHGQVSVTVEDSELLISSDVYEGCDCVKVSFRGESTFIEGLTMESLRTCMLGDNGNVAPEKTLKIEYGMNERFRAFLDPPQGHKESRWNWRRLRDSVGPDSVDPRTEDVKLMEAWEVREEMDVLHEETEKIKDEQREHYTYKETLDQYCARIGTSCIMRFVNGHRFTDESRVFDFTVEERLSLLRGDTKIATMRNNLANSGASDKQIKVVINLMQSRAGNMLAYLLKHREVEEIRGDTTIDAVLVTDKRLDGTVKNSSVYVYHESQHLVDNSYSGAGIRAYVTASGDVFVSVLYHG